MDVSQFEIGDIISFKLSTGEEIQAMSVKKEQDRNTLFCSVNCLNKKYDMNWHRNGKPYSDTPLRHFLNKDIVCLFPEEIKSRLVKFNNGDYLRIPTEKEIFGRNYNSESEDGTEQWEPMKLYRNRVVSPEKTDLGSYWLQNNYSEAPFMFRVANFWGTTDCAPSDWKEGVRLVFLLHTN